MGNFLENLPEWSAKAAAAIAQAVADNNNDKANMLSGLKTTANDGTLSNDIRLNALTAMINLGGLLDIPLPPYFPTITTYANTQTFVGVHNDLEGLQGGAPGEYYHLTEAEKNNILNKASLGDISWANLSGNYSDNTPFAALFDAKQNALSGTGLVRINGTQNTITYDNAPYITTIDGISAGGELSGTYPNPILSNAAVIGKLLTGFNPNASAGSITEADTIFTALQKLNANITNVITNPSGVSTVALTNNASTVFTTTSSPQSGEVTLNLALNSQNGNLVLASPNGGVGAPVFRELLSGDLPNSGANAGTYGSNTVIPQIQVDAKGRITSIIGVTAASGGQVNTISLSVPAFLSPSNVNNTFPSAPDIQIQLAPQAANFVFAGPESGDDAEPDFRQLVVADIPNNIPIDNIDGLRGELNSKMSDSLGGSLIFMGNGSLKAVQTKVGGDLTAEFELVGTENTGTFTIVDEAVTYAKFQNIPDSSLTTQRPILLGRFDLGQGVMQQMTLSGDFTLSETGQIGLRVPNPPALTNVGDLLTSTGSDNLVALPVGGDGYLLMPYAAASTPACGLIWGEVGGDISYTVDATNPATPFGNFSIGDNKVTLGKIEKIPLNTILGNNTANPDDVAALTATQVTAMLDQFNTTAKGLTPAASFTPAADKTLADYFLNANGAWSLGGGGSGNPGGSANQIQYNSGGTTFGGTVDMEYISGTGVYATAANFFITNSASTRDRSINFNVIAVNGDYTWAFPDAGSTFVGTDVSQTLTNKTLGSNTAIDIGTNATGTMWYADSGGVLAEIDPTGADGKYLKFTSGVPSWQGVSVTSTANIAGGAQWQIPYQTAPSTTGFINVPTTPNTYLKWNGSAIVWDTAGSGSGTVGSGTQYQLAYYAGAGTTTTVSGLTSITANSALVSDANGLPVASTVSTTQLQYLASASGTVSFGTGGTVAYIGTANSWTSGVKQTFSPSATTAGINVGSLAGQPSSPANGDLVYNTSSSALQAYINGAWVSLGGGVTSFSAGTTGLTPSTATTGAVTLAGTLGIANGGTGLTSVGSNGTILTSNGTSASWQAASATLVVGTSAITSGTIGRVLFQGTGNVLQQSANLFWDNTNGRLSIGGSATPSGLFQIAAGTATVPQLLLSPSTITPTGTNNGSLWCNTVSSNTSLQFYKDSSLTRIITLDRNPDLATSNSGVLQADTSGTLFKGAELTALGVYAQTNTITAITTGSGSLIGTLIGNATLPANFFATGKTLEFLLAGLISTAASGGPSVAVDFKITDGTTTVTLGTLTYDTTNLTSRVYTIDAELTCRTSGSNPTFGICGQMIVNHTAKNQETVFITPGSVTGTSLNTSSALTLQITATWTNAGATSSIDTRVNYCQYIN